jgi:YHS domain-containing protein
VHAWLDGLLEGVDADREVTLLDEVAWTPTVEGAAFALTCAECGNTVDSEGESTRFDGDVYHFCCSTCLARFEERYRRIEEDA